MRLSLCLLSLLAAVTLIMLLSGCPQQPSAQPPPMDPAMQSGAPALTGEPVVIGAIFSVTGQAGAPLGEPEKITAQMLEERVNAQGGINGRPLKIIIEDDASDESKAVMACKKLIEQDKVIAIVGPTLSGPTLAIVKTCNDAGVPLFSCAASAKITSPVAERKSVFSSAQTDVLAVERVLSYLQSQKIKKVAIICDSNAFGKSGEEQLKKQLPAGGVDIVEEQRFLSKDASMVAQLTKIKAKNPEAIICWGTNPGPAQVAKNAKSLGIKSALIMSHGIANKKFIELAAEAAEGVVFPAGKLLVVNELADGDAQKSVLKEYAQAYETFAKAPANTFGGHAYDALQMIIAAVKVAGDDKAKLRDAIESTKSYVGIGGTFNLSAEDHNGLNQDAFAMVTIKDGQWTMVK